MREEILRLLDVAEGAGLDVIKGAKLDVTEGAKDGCILATMGSRGNSRTAQDIPVAAEMLGLLRHFGGSLDSIQVNETELLPLRPGIYDLVEPGKIVALVPVQAGTLDLVAYWISQGIQSPELVAMPGLLAIPFSIEEHDDGQWLIPEWFALYYVDSSDKHCVPLLTLRSVLDDNRFGDWVSTALARAGVFQLPTAAATAGAQRVILEKAPQN